MSAIDFSDLVDYGIFEHSAQTIDCNVDCVALSVVLLKPAAIFFTKLIRQVPKHFFCHAISIEFNSHNFVDFFKNQNFWKKDINSPNSLQTKSRNITHYLWMHWPNGASLRALIKCMVICLSPCNRIIQDLSGKF